MRAVFYIVLIVFVLWGGVVWEQAHAPLAPVNQETQDGVVAVESQVPPAEKKEIEEDEEGEGTEVETLSVTQPGALVGSQAALPAVPPGQEEVTYDEEYVEALEAAIHVRINEERKIADLDLLAYDETLAQIAAYHSTDMAKEDYFAHEDENGCDSACRVTSAGYEWRMVGENLFKLERSTHFSVEGASAIIVAGWMGSPGHRKNIMQSKFTYEGIGVVIKGDAIYATEVFARPR